MLGKKSTWAACWNLSHCEYLTLSSPRFLACSDNCQCFCFTVKVLYILISHPSFITLGIKLRSASCDLPNVSYHTNLVNCLMQKGSCAKWYVLGRHLETQVAYQHCFLMFIYFWERQRGTERERGRGRERGGHRIRSRLRAPSCRHRARHDAVGLCLTFLFLF